ncbi:MAG: phosphoribosylformylglycinamidine synthase subunit PurS [Deltaproteobacteria bacterium]|nr:phosphoribosylformylglycinamidine synthase subunit PurS [Deltaproteobacteria bacterium]
MIAKVYITLKSGVLDPQGKTVQHALESLAFNEVRDVRIGKYIEIRLADADQKVSEKRVKEMCEKLLANTVIESYRYEIVS